MDTAVERKVMVVADPTRESAGALQYALSHAIVENDSMILFHVENPYAWRNPFGSLFRKSSGGGSVGGGGAATSSSTAVAAEGGGGGGEVDFLDEMRRACAVAQPRVKVAVVKAEMADGKDKAAVILAFSAANKVDLIIVGHKRSLSNAILGSRRGGTRGLDTADNLILNSKCTCVAVQKKGQNAGYLLTSKTYKNFWLLA